MVAYLERTDGNADFHKIVDFFSTSPIYYALTVSPTIYASYIEQFWNTVHSQTVSDVKQIHATVNGKIVVISESSVRSDLHFNDEDDITCLTNKIIFENIALMGYESDSDKLTFQENLFSPQWKYLIHTILHCLSSKSTSWNEFSTNIASAVICLANGQKFNFSKLIFDGMLRNLDTNTKKFLMYLRFLQLFFNNQISLVEPFNDIYKTPVHTKKVFTNIKRKRKDFSGRITPLFASMLTPPVVEGEGLGKLTKPQPAPSTTQPIIEEQIPTSVPIPNVADEAVFKESDDRVVRATTTAASLDAAQASVNTPGRDEERLEQHELMDSVPPTPHDSPLPGGHTPGSDEGRLQQEKFTNIVTALSQKVEGLESDLKKTKKLYATAFKKLINRDLVTEDPSKQGRSLIEEMDLDVGISLVPPHVEVQGRYGQNLETQKGFGDGQEVSTIALVSTSSTFVSTASPQRNAYTTADDLTLAETLMEIRKSDAKDKGKAKMDETESPRKMKQRERAQISRDEEVAQKLQE
ncbi:hypothetical protein Tco_0629268 [Tanacetum coccineum]|uniref:Synaptobrevin, longin-like domain protein n=1 Tax=Tanacetum coccineum TaxID=301880 RepID=A0ABQ4WTB6_9ASTR